MENNSTDESSSSPSNHFEFLDYDFHPSEWSLDCLRQAALQHKLMRPRSLAWAILLHTLPPPHGDIVTSIKTHRNFYDDLKTKLSMDPRAVIGDDPLSQNDESAWRQHFCDNELKAVILQDVVRTFPDELYFRDKDVQDMLVRILFFWARSHSHVGYRQGMHEILAPLLFELFQDRQFAPRALCDTLRCVLDDAYIEHDSYMLFSSVIKGLERFYTTGDIVPMACGRLPSSKVVHNPNEVVRYLDKVKEEFLVPLDSELAAHLDNCNISMELFGIRWLRLLFGREFPRDEVAPLWGFLFADGPSLPHVHFVVLAMLISIRTTLLQSDPGWVLSALMRPLPLRARYVTALALHLRAPLQYPRPEPPRPPQPDTSISSTTTSTWALEQTGEVGANGDGDADGDSGSEGVPEGGDVARELAALALLRARLPPAAAQLAAAIPRPPPHIAQPLQQILQLAALLQCRNHALIDVETALEAAEGHNSDKVGRRQLVPVAMIPKRTPNKTLPKPANRIKEVPLKVFHQAECKTTSDLPFMDPLRLRTE